jgi:hypothetical protein
MERDAEGARCTGSLWPRGKAMKQEWLHIKSLHAVHYDKFNNGFILIIASFS